MSAPDQRPLAPHELTAAWLTDVLRDGGFLTDGHVVDLRVAPRDTSEAIVAQLEVTYSTPEAPAGTEKLFFKASRPGLAGNRQRGPREVGFYSGIGSEVRPGALPRCFHAALSADGSGYHLLFESLVATHFQCQWPLPPDDGACVGIVDCLSRLHAQWWDDPRLGFFGRLPDDASVQGNARWLEKNLPRFFDFLGDRLEPHARAVYESMLEGSPRLTARLTGRQGLTVVHGDAHCWNFLLPRDPERDSVRLIDWAAWHPELPSMDLAYLMAVHWYPERRARLEKPLLRHYHERLVEHGVAGYSWDDCWDDYRYAVFRTPTVAVWQWSAGLSCAGWWGHLERSLAAFRDLGCHELVPR